MNNAEDEEIHAKNLLAAGLCDRKYFTEEFCTKWKAKRDSTPISKEQQEVMAQLHPLCPVNLVTPSDCQFAKQELYKRYAIPDPLGASMGKMFQPGKAISWLPGGGPAHLFPGRPALPSLFKSLDSDDVPLKLFTIDGRVESLVAFKRAGGIKFRPGSSFRPGPPHLTPPSTIPRSST
ncbi:hypothetical protein O988_00317 [Pseudogymnoascus sp. VKM F-3808]|nr:hypothetical protein O988_00317 [Pseudogymnoascus sp. VKM F-3808]